MAFEIIGLVTAAGLSQFTCYTRNRYLSEHRLSQRLIKESETSLRRIFDANTDSVTVVDVETGRIRDVNDEFVRATGYQREVAIGSTTAELGMWESPDDQHDFANRIGGTGCVRNLEVNLRKRDGTLLPCQISSAIVPLSGRKCVLSFVHDISDLKRSEQILSLNEEKFRRIFESNLDVVIVSEGRTGKMLEVNEQFVRRSGYAREEALGKRPVELGLWAEPAQRDELMRELKQNRRVEGMEAVFLARDGSVTPYLLSTSPINLAGVNCWLSVLHDISGIKEAQARLSESEATLRKVFDVNLDAMGIVDVATRRYVNINREFIRSTGYSAEEIIDRTADDLNLWVDLADEERFVAALTEKSEVRDMLAEFRLKDGTVVPCLTSGVIAELGGRLCCVTIARNISELNAAQQKLRGSEAMLREIFDSSIDNIGVTDLSDGSLVDVNKELVSSLGFAKQEMIGRRFEELNAWADPERHQLFLKTLRETGEVRNFQNTLRARDGHTFPALISAVALELGGRRCALSIARDITDLEAARQAALAASKAKSEFLSSMSHEIRTPMNAILGMADLLGESDLRAEQRRYLDTIISNGNALLEIINSILDLAKVESGRFSLEAAEFDVIESTERAAETLAVHAHEKHIELAVRFAPDLPARWVGDSLRLRQILLNLIGNAIKFTERGEVVVSVKRNVDSTVPGNLLFEVRDTGIGIPQDELTNIFSAFTQADSSTTRKFGGSGLGLAIVARLTALMGGRVSVESQVGRGSVFRFTIDLRELPAAVSESSSTSEPDLRGLRGLVVDANATAREIACEILAARGALVTQVTSGSLALAALAGAPMEGREFDLMLVDSDTVALDAFEKARHARGLGQSATVVIMMSSNGITNKMKAMREFGVKHYAAKPLRRSELLDAIAAALPHTVSAQPACAAPAAHNQNAMPGISLPKGADRPLRILLTDDCTRQPPPDRRVSAQEPLRPG